MQDQAATPRKSEIQLEPQISPVKSKHGKKRKKELEEKTISYFAMITHTLYYRQIDHCCA